MPQPSEPFLPVAASRGVRRASFTLVTPANHYPSRLPGFPGAQVVKLVTPRLAPARFGQYLLSLDGSGTVEAGFESFLYGLEGSVALRADGVEHRLAAGGFAYLPPELGFSMAGAGRVLWLKRRLEAWPGLAAPRRGRRPPRRRAVRVDRRPRLPPPRAARPGRPAPGLQHEPAGVRPRRRARQGRDPRRGARPLHDRGRGPSTTSTQSSTRSARGDFVYMAPYCPQSFVATGREPAEYLLYKDVYRDGF